MTDAPLEEVYLRWLADKIHEFHPMHPTRTYWDLLSQMQRKRFVPRVKYDINREHDGRDLRLLFAEETGIEIPVQWIDEGCSFLELMVALARRLVFIVDGSVHFWFWDMIRNLGLEVYWDRARKSKQTERAIDDILNRVIERTYDPDGRGGFFPIRHPERDQRQVEIWQQLSTYALERI